MSKEKTTNCTKTCPFNNCIWKGEYKDKYYEDQKEKCYIKYYYNKIEK